MTHLRSILSSLALLIVLAFSPFAARAADAPAAPNPLAWPTLKTENKMAARWWWLGSAVDSAGISTQLGELDAAGFGGVEVTVIYGAKGAESSYIPYLSRPWVT